MEKNYEHITEMENIMTHQEDTIQSLEDFLNTLDTQMDDYKKLVVYYYSQQRDQDLDDDAKHLIPEDLKRGVLSEDGVYNMFLDTHDVAIHMMETALKLLKLT